MSIPPQNNAQPAPLVLTIPTQTDPQLEREHILKLFPKGTILTFSIIHLSCAALLDCWILQVRLYFDKI